MATLLDQEGRVSEDPPYEKSKLGGGTLSLRAHALKGSTELVRFREAYRFMNRNQARSSIWFRSKASVSQTTYPQLAIPLYRFLLGRAQDLHEQPPSLLGAQN